MSGLLSRGLATALGLLLVGTRWVSAAGPLPAAPPGLACVHEEDLSAKTLRGYGRVAGRFAEYAAADKSRASLLRITCADAPRAALTLGKYRSDLCQPRLFQDHAAEFFQPQRRPCVFRELRIFRRQEAWFRKISQSIPYSLK